MPAKLTLTSGINVSTNTTTLAFNNTTNGYLITSDMNLSGNQLIIGATKMYFVGISVSIEQNGTTVLNTAWIQVLRNGSPILEYTQSYNENDEITLESGAYFNLNAGDVITARITFNTLSPNKIFVLANPWSTFLNVV